VSQPVGGQAQQPVTNTITEENTSLSLIGKPSLAERSVVHADFRSQCRPVYRWVTLNLSPEAISPWAHWVTVPISPRQCWHEAEGSQGSTETVSRGRTPQMEPCQQRFLQTQLVSTRGTAQRLDLLSTYGESSVLRVTGLPRPLSVSESQQGTKGCDWAQGRGRQGSAF
jgi:hypothetical protein